MVQIGPEEIEYGLSAVKIFIVGMNAHRQHTAPVSLPEGGGRYALYSLKHIRILAESVGYVIKSKLLACSEGIPVIGMIGGCKDLGIASVLGKEVLALSQLLKLCIIGHAGIFRGNIA